jgi:RHS repeat-associated protein
VNVALDANNVPTNRIAAQGVMYDNNGNQTQGFGLAMTYDVANRLSAVGNGTFSYYAYDSDNRRIYSRNASGSETIYFYGADGMRIATYTYTMITYNGNAEIQLTQQSQNVYFLGKPISAEGNLVSTDRLGSVRSGGPGGLGYQAQYPYGVEYSLTANDREKYATYTRDSATGFDYATNRYYASQWGRFLSPDPYVNSAGLGDPGSWNRYAYTGGDPINRSDPTGNAWICIGISDDCLLTYFDDNPSGGAGGAGSPHARGPYSDSGQHGGHGGQGIGITKLSTTSKKAISVQNDLRWLQAAIAQDPNCDHWLQSNGQNINLAINYMLDAPGSGATAMMVGVGSFSDNAVNAMAGTGGTNLTPGSMLITVNTSGAFFNSGPASSVGYGVPSWITGGSPAAQALILLHELAHVVGAAGFNNNDYGNATAEKNNNTLVMRNCGDIVNLLGNH